MFRKLAGASVAAAAVKEADKKEETSSKSHVCKPSELPLYSPLHKETSKHPEDHSGPVAASKPLNAVEEGIRAVRVSVQSVSASLSDQKHHVQDFVEEAKVKTKFVKDYLNEEDNSVPRAGAIAVGGLAGLILGLRGGFIRRLFYTSIGAGGVASICYPKEAEIYAQHALVEAKKYAAIGYNFIYGIKPGDEKQKNLPKIPSNLDELKEGVSGLASKAYDAVFGEKKK